MAQQLSFEKAYARLEEILEVIQSGKASLEESITLYEEANHLMTLCSNTLNDAEKKIEVIMKNKEGSALVNAQGHIQTQTLS